MSFITGMCLSALLILIGYRLAQIKDCKTDEKKEMPYSILNMSSEEYRNFLNYDGSEQE